MVTGVVLAGVVVVVAGVVVDEIVVFGTQEPC